MLTLMQLETAIILHKPVLVTPIDKDSNSKKLWTRYELLYPPFCPLHHKITYQPFRIVHLCVAYLRVFCMAPRYRRAFALHMVLAHPVWAPAMRTSYIDIYPNNPTH